MLRNSKFLIVAAVSISIAIGLSIKASRAATQPSAASTPAPPVAVLGKSKRSLASFAKSNSNPKCFDRKTEPYIAVVDAHFHPRPFGGAAIPPAKLIGFFDKTGVRFVNYFGIGQSPDMASTCTYYLDCPGTNALPSIKNDFVNGEEVKDRTPPPNVNIILSMTYHRSRASAECRGNDQALRQRISWDVQMGRRAECN